MTAEQLEELLGHTGSTDDHLHFGAVEELKALAPSLALRVIAAEKLVVAAHIALDVMEWVDGENDCSRGIDALEEALTAYREASQ